MDVRPVADSQAKFATRAAAAAPEYQKGVANAGGRWQAGVNASEDAWASGTQEAIANRRYGAGARKAGPAKYQDRASKLGPDRFRTGVNEGAPEWGRNFAPFASELSGMPLEPRGMRGSEQNFQRSRAVGQRLRAKKLELLGSR
jgi:hypothetical protein